MAEPDVTPLQSQPSQPTIIEHHWHDPPKRELTKALFQFLNDQKINRETLEPMVEAKVKECISQKLDQMFTGDAWKRVLTHAVEDYIRTNVPSLSQTAGAVNFVKARIDDIVRQAIIDKLDIVITAKPAKPAGPNLMPEG